MTPQDSPVEKIVKGLIVFATSEAYRKNGLHFNAEDKALAKGIQPLTKVEAIKDIETLLLEARIDELNSVAWMADGEDTPKDIILRIEDRINRLKGSK